MYEATISIKDVLVFCSFKNLSNIYWKQEKRRASLTQLHGASRILMKLFLFFSFLLTGSEQMEAQHTNGFTELHIITEVSHCYWIKRSSLILF